MKKNLLILKIYISFCKMLEFAVFNLSYLILAFIVGPLALVRLLSFIWFIFYNQDLFHCVSNIQGLDDILAELFNNQLYMGDDCDLIPENNTSLLFSNNESSTGNDVQEVANENGLNERDPNYDADQSSLSSLSSSSDSINNVDDTAQAAASSTNDTATGTNGIANGDSPDSSSGFYFSTDSDAEDAVTCRCVRYEDHHCDCEHPVIYEDPRMSDFHNRCHTCSEYGSTHSCESCECRFHIGCGNPNSRFVGPNPDDDPVSD